MWEWSRSVAERAAASVCNSHQSGQARPAVVDPEPWSEEADRGGDRRDDTTGPSDTGAYSLAG
jgi:hypothetical protein